MRWIATALVIALSPVSGCGALSSLSKAGAELDAYTLTPARSVGTARGGRGHLIVELPSSAGALATDRILIKPVPYQAQYLPDGRWSEPAPALLQTLLVASFQNLGGFELVGRTANGLNPDYTLMTELQDFQVEPLGPEGGEFVIRISMMMTLIREADRQIVTSRRFSAAKTVASDDTRTLVSGFDSALQSVLLEIVAWTAR
ncbi:ABC-type transport auxiliary lipoprotein family protein [Tabrizicola sp.]|uniref:ABC-type transport auxiliary lipoprotein family protein n=1 Tax=Tabrizicola sp. TaxID=2005166 RepID=UPI00273609F5|nr:ABC-type transport auxiliary lipoprotein family protein [Tabrizicola sp.]MDP3197976.1 ABC-type transport auxiliary lipoprotein family protein [Tabrizicola sp.]